MSHKKKCIEKNFEKEKLNDEKIFDDFFNRLSNENLRIKSLNGDPFENIKYMICKSKSQGQIFSFRFNDYENITKEEEKLIKNYCCLYDLFNNQMNSINCNNFFHMEKTNENTNVIFVSDNYIIFATLNLFYEYEDVFNIISDCTKMIKSKENYFFSLVKI